MVKNILITQSDITIFVNALPAIFRKNFKELTLIDVTYLSVDDYDEYILPATGELGSLHITTEDDYDYFNLFTYVVRSCTNEYVANIFYNIIIQIATERRQFAVELKEELSSRIAALHDRLPQPASPSFQ